MENKMNLNNDLKLAPDILERSEIASWSNMYENSEKGCELYKIKSSTCLSIPNYDSLTYNRVMLDNPDIFSTDDFTAFDDFYSRKGGNRYMISENPHIETKLTEQFFGSNGYKLHNCWIKLYLDLDTASYQSTKHSNILPLLPTQKEEYIQLI
jgi:hypothetical protein